MPLTLFTERREKRQWKREKPDRFSIIPAGRKTIESPMTRAYRRPTNGLRSPGTGMSWDSACTERQTEINERQAETGLSSRILRGMFREIHGKSNRAVCLQPNGIYGTNGTTAGIQGGKITRYTTKSGISVRVFPIFPEE